MDRLDLGNLIGNLSKELYDSSWEDLEAAEIFLADCKEFEGKIYRVPDDKVIIKLEHGGFFLVDFSPSTRDLRYNISTNQCPNISQFLNERGYEPKNIPRKDFKGPLKLSKPTN